LKNPNKGRGRNGEDTSRRPAEEGEGNLENKKKIGHSYIGRKM